MTHGTTPMTPATLMGLSISLATGLYGLSFGALAVAAGLTVTQTVVLSAVMFTGGSQFAFVGVIATGGSPAAAVGAATMLYLRNAIYGAQMAVLLSPRGPWKFLAAHITIDESAGTASIQDTFSERHRGFWVAGIGVFLLWNLFTLAGALLGDTLGNPQTFGLDGAAVAAFLALLWPRLTQRPMRTVAYLAALGAIVSIPYLPSGMPLLVAAAIAGTMGWRTAHIAHRAHTTHQETP